MELLHKEKMGADFMCVGAKFPTLKKERPVSSRHLVMEAAGTKEKCKFIVSFNEYLIRTHLPFEILLLSIEIE